MAVHTLEVISVIRVVTTNGSGKDDDPYRIVTEFWDMDGNKLAEVDNWLNADRVERLEEAKREIAKTLHDTQRAIAESYKDEL